MQAQYDTKFNKETEIPSDMTSRSAMIQCRRVKLAANELVARAALRDPQLNRTRRVSGAGAFRWAGPNLSRSGAVCGAVHRKSAQRVPGAVRSAGGRTSTKTVHALSSI